MSTRAKKTDSSFRRSGNTSNKSGKAGSSFDPAGILQDFTKTTSRVVHQAAAILEEEIAAGVVAAKQVEDQLVDVKKARSGESAEVIQRFRKDAHDLVDIVLDMLAIASEKATDVSDNMLSFGTGTSSKRTGKTSGGTIPTLVIPKTLRPGDSFEIEMMLENESDKQINKISMICNDLINSDGKKITARNVAFSPGVTSLKPKAQANVTIGITIPKAAEAGSYSGIIRATNMNQLQAILVVNVSKN